MYTQTRGRCARHTPGCHATAIDLSSPQLQLPSFDTDTISFKAGLLDPDTAPRRDIFVIMKKSNSVPPTEAMPENVYGCRFKTWKAIFQAKTGKVTDVYDLAVDPGESINLLDAPGNVWEAIGPCASKGPTSRKGYETVYACCAAMLSLVTR